MAKNTTLFKAQVRDLARSDAVGHEIRQGNL